jgi:tetratricopeptide (TPR) repeat protein
MDDISQKPYLAKMLYENKRAPEAVALMRECLLAQPHNEDYRILLALYLRALGNFDESLFYLDKVSSTIPGYKMLKGWHLLRQGHWNAGMQMREPELGIHRMESLFPFPTHKRYVKGESLRNKRVLFVLEGGNGDEIAYLRFAQYLSERGAVVMTASSLPFVDLCSRALGVSTSMPINSIDHDAYDYYIPAMSMFSLFDINNPSNDISFPYVTPHANTTELWQPIIDNASTGKLKIGIQWQGNPEFDHVEFKTLPAPLLSSFAQFGKLYLIQRPETITPDNQLPESVDAFNTQSEAPDWEQTLAVINMMDVVIAGDTTITHMAGALGKKTIVLLPHAPHPYWADLKDTSTWYPSISVIRQPEYNAWDKAVDIAMTRFPL